ncbi:hypothetical protein GUA46_09100 [Muricauda sp. HICW]|uniref:Pierisin-like domain-containing protein n=1 Tax=Flagellimonas chongwuensis TaxID=2697365 RepID=A0A850NJG9_9FLAO|nr:hypothetical protein [Allomuricauda chongwuensis]NVN18498.1 hypothetical protein [Allomuricauda chongwuensis]
MVYATAVKNAGKIVKLANGTTVLVKFSKETTERLVDVLKRLDLDAAQLKKLSDDLTDKEFAEAIAENPELVDSWKILDNAGVDDALRKNEDNLTGTKNYLDNNPSRVDEFKSHLSTEASKRRDGLYLKSLLERKEFKGTVYRGDKALKTPAEVFENGFSSLGTHDNLLNHIESNTTRGDFVSTTKDISIANQFTSKNGYIYEIRSQKGVDVNSTLGDDADAFFLEQVEVSMPGGIYHQIQKGLTLKGKLHLNILFLTRIM